MSVLQYFQTVYNSVGNFLSYAYTFVATLVDINFKTVTVAVETCQDVASAVANAIRVAHSLTSNVISSAFDFIVEVFSLFYAFVLVLWKFIVFLASVLYSAYQLVELVLYFIVNNIVSFCQFLTCSVLSCWDYFTCIGGWIYYYLSQTSVQILDAVSVIGSTASEGTISFFKFIKLATLTFFRSLDNGMMGFADSVRNMTDFVYYGMVDLMYLKQETYLGLLICLLTFLLVANMFKSLKQRGLTFPGIQENFEVPYTRGRTTFGFDFSDNEEDTDDNIIDDDTDSTVASSEDDDDDDEIEEYEVEDLTTDDEELSDSDSNPSIDIQLPPVSSGSYNLRRSTTPSRINVHSSEDFQKEIEKEKEKIMCVVCQDLEKSVLILPCRHLCLCIRCGNTIARARNVDRRVCPLCRKKIETIMNVYT